MGHLKEALRGAKPLRCTGFR